MDNEHLNAEQAQSLISQPESHFLDFKSKRIQPGKATQTISSFANADGGELFIGIEDAKVAGERWSGFSDQEAANAHIALLSSLYPEGDSFLYTFLTADNCDGIVIKIEILKNRRVWPDSSSDFYVRRGAQNMRLDREGVRRLEFDKGTVTYEDEKLNVGLDYIQEDDALKTFLATVVPTVDAERWLKKQQLIVNDRLTVAGAILFSDEPQPLLPKAAVKIYRYQTSDLPTRESLEGQP